MISDVLIQFAHFGSIRMLLFTHVFIQKCQEIQIWTASLNMNVKIGSGRGCPKNTLFKCWVRRARGGGKTIGGWGFHDGAAGGRAGGEVTAVALPGCTTAMGRFL